MKKQKVKLMNYSRTEDMVNAVTHVIGVPLGIAALVLCIKKSLEVNSTIGVIASVVYGVSIILLYAGSAFYHGVKPSKLKKVLRVLDHCNIFLLIAGTMTPFSLIAFRPSHPILCWVTIIFAWSCALFGIVGTAINQEKFKVVQMVLYISIGWVLIFAIRPMLTIFHGLQRPGLTLLIVGGALYTVGAIFCGLGKKLPYFHALFHGFVLAGTVTHFLSVYRYVLAF
ncbi:MAG TPA: hemolysin III family protein [Clostridia bacterium]|nr:hemolysin III family protein [Clostridia bacterium]